jgi:hypothetical protein
MPVMMTQGVQTDQLSHQSMIMADINSTFTASTTPFSQPKPVPIPRSMGSEEMVLQNLKFQFFTLVLHNFMQVCYTVLTFPAEVKVRKFTKIESRDKLINSHTLLFYSIYYSSRSFSTKSKTVGTQQAPIIGLNQLPILVSVSS